MEKITFHALENRVDTGIVTFGAPWKKESRNTDAEYRLMDGKGNNIPVQSRNTAYWPDGSVKWSAHSCILTGNSPYVLTCTEEQDRKQNVSGTGIEASDLRKQPITRAEGTSGIHVISDKGRVIVDAGSTKAEFIEGGYRVIQNMVINDRLTVSSGKLIYISEERNEDDHKTILSQSDYIGRVDKVTVEEEGSIKCVIRLEGVHECLGKELIPFVLRFTFAYNETYVKVMHTFLYNGEAKLDFMKAIGISFKCPIEGELYNRHIKISGENGVFQEASQLLLSWRPRLPEKLYDLQNLGVNIAKEIMAEENIKTALADMTIWDSYRLYQDSARHYSIKKGTGKDNCCHIDAVQGGRAGGIIAVGGENGGIAVGMRDFWQKYPSSLWVENMSKDMLQATAWIWSYEQEAMDFRHYDTVGHASAYYEGFDEVGSTPYGIANSNELVIFGFTSGIPENSKIMEYEKFVQKPPVLHAAPEYYHSVKAFGEWSLVNKTTLPTAWLEEQLDSAFHFYLNEIEQREWYGFYNYGDFMHTYDKARHCWRYDMGGYAWQNTELVPTLWLWYAYLRSGREDIFTVAEAMTRHCSEVDLYHFGNLKGLGSRHNVLHWGCSCKEPRIAMAGHHRFYYYMMGDYRLGDVFEEVKDADFSTLFMNPLRHFYDKETMDYPTHARSGPDWSSYCSNWMTAWERNKEEKYKDKIRTGIEDIKKSPYRLISGSNYEYDPTSGHLRYIGENASGGSHLTICMGGPSIWFELADLLKDEEWKEMLAEYGDFYFASREEKALRAETVRADKGFAFPYMAAAMGAYGARYYKKKELGDKVWKTLIEELDKASREKGFEKNAIESYLNRKDLKEIPWISTNFTAQWCLNVILCLELLKDYLPNPK